MSRREPYSFSASSSSARSEAAPRIWRTLDEKRDPSVYAAQAAAEEGVAQGDPSIVSVQNLAVGRRRFLSLAGAGTALAAGLQGCIRRPAEKILPYTRQPEYLVPGVANHYATTLTWDDDVLGVVVTSYEGRPTKVEGNAEHPWSGGATNVWAQAEVLSLYDPDRAQHPTQRTAGTTRETRDWSAFERALKPLTDEWKRASGEGLAVVLRPSRSRTLRRELSAFQAAYPKARVYVYSPADRSTSAQALERLYGKRLTAVHHYDRARTILALDADVLLTEPGQVRAVRGFTAGRRPEAPESFNRLYVVEPTLTTTGSSADHRLQLPGSQVRSYLQALIRTLVSDHDLDIGVPASALAGEAPKAVPQQWLREVARELVANRGRSIVVAGFRQSRDVHELVHQLNQALGNVGTTIEYHADLEPLTANAGSLGDLVLALGRREVKALVVLGGNPALDAPGDLDFAANLGKVPLSIALGSHLDETGSLCTWHLPAAHALESWGDAQALDGTWSICQPLIAPLWQGRSVVELVAMLRGEFARSGYTAVRETFAAESKEALSELAWHRALKTGVAQPASTPATVARAALSSAALDEIAAAAKGEGAGNGLELSFGVDPKLLDGHFANNAWLLELPDPVTKITWDNVALVSPKTADSLKLRSGDVISIAAGERGKVEGPVFVLPGVADGTVAVTFGWGRTHAGSTAAGHGFNSYAARTASSLWFVRGARVAPTGVRYPIAQTQEHNVMEGRPIAIDGTLEEYESKPDFAQTESVEPAVGPLWKEVDYSNKHAWGMSVDLSTCTGCTACVIACQSENNVPVVGKDEVAKGREMHWLRIDRYFVGESESNPDVAFQPMMCQHCEEAPCENVCPVNATVHSPEGLNEMAYNRCIGTRYCSNNCPYKVRRFNFLHYTEGTPEPTRMQFNPNVTVRFRGVMEKCTYCVQRIENVRITRKNEGKPIQDGDVTSACAQACPANAIVFGDLNDANSRVAKLAKSQRRYRVLAEIGTQPRTFYQAKVRNPNPAFAHSTES